MNKHEFAICINNRGYEVSLETRKLYEILADADAEKHQQIRVIDESGEDYLYPASLFDRITLPAHVIERVFHAQI
ncbi:hypothetical protein [Methylocucumis oryzae]|jgi:hypothetical protein|uniref:Uncharacterized protein n=1 Tax=Methylocucumis oryzae TaxID=1632867 RepID=A0A0F3IHW0_9GAMM|nr:hypothetical protein [Methylocucumis oryzae]KJV06341.1 hypothetical protein VZ94_11945 [Methylocucumis oryzae]